MEEVRGREQDQAWAGGLAGFVSGILLFPAETVSARYKLGGKQVISGLLRREGVLALWSGAGAGMLGTIPSSAIYFVLYENFKSRGERAVPNHQSHLLPGVYLVAGGVSEALTSVVYVPFEVTKARMMLGRNPNLASNGHIAATTNYPNSLVALYNIARYEGRAGLYAGYVPCMLTDMSFRGLTFMLYELGKRRLVETRYGEVNESSAEDLLLGLVCGGSAALVTNPLDVLTLRAMTKKMGSHVRAFSYYGLWRGVACRVASLAPQSAVSLAVFEAAMRLLSGDDDN
ncbi:hypothetical protein BASA81_004428 [Batrachochytrium salamandrivorans]|nr:hypothetical protein BASA81_004428 [Batrachochytrium salamandrivorans]